MYMEQVYKQWKIGENALVLEYVIKTLFII